MTPKHPLDVLPHPAGYLQRYIGLLFPRSEPAVDTIPPSGSGRGGNPCDTFHTRFLCARDRNDTGTDAGTERLGEIERTPMGGGGEGYSMAGELVVVLSSKRHTKVLHCAPQDVVVKAAMQSQRMGAACLWILPPSWEEGY